MSALKEAHGEYRHNFVPVLLSLSPATRSPGRDVIPGAANDELSSYAKVNFRLIISDK